MTSSIRSLAVTPSGSSTWASRLLTKIAPGVSCQGETPVLSWAARIPNIVTMTRVIIPRMTQAAPVCEP